jgi:histidine phosphotransfer protein HptB
MTEQAPIDIAGANERLGLGDEFYKQMLDMFLEEAPSRLQAIRDAMQRGDTRTFERSAHSLKGAAGNLGVEGVRALAEQVEILGKEKRMLDAPPLLVALESELQRVAQYLLICFAASPAG